MPCIEGCGRLLSYGCTQDVTSPIIGPVVILYGQVADNSRNLNLDYLLNSTTRQRTAPGFSFSFFFSYLFRDELGQRLAHLPPTFGTARLAFALYTLPSVYPNAQDLIRLAGIGNFRSSDRSF